MFRVKLKSFLRDYFTLTSRERKGILVLAVIIGIQILYIFRLHYLSPPEAPVITSHSLQLAAYERQLSSNDSVLNAPGGKTKSGHTPTADLFKFDPNTISDREWMRLGLSQKQTKVIRNYLSKGGRFRDKASVSKMYSITEAQFRLLEPYIEIPAAEKNIHSPATAGKYEKKKIEPVELNSADTILLASLPMIGPGRARLIFRYRERLGGFFSVDQLLEVFTIDTMVLSTIKPYIFLDTGKIRKLDLNNDSLSHPYISRKTASAIVAYRRQHGNFIDINDLRKVAVLDEQLWLKVVPYATFE